MEAYINLKDGSLHLTDYSPENEETTMDIGVELHEIGSQSSGIDSFPFIVVHCEPGGWTRRFGSLAEFYNALKVQP